MIKKLFAKILDNIGISLLYREHSKVMHFKPASGFHTDDQAEIYPKPEVPDVTLTPESIRDDGYELGRFEFESAIASTHKENDGARGEYYMRRDSKQPVSVVLVHGWRMEHLERVHKMFTHTFLQAGYDLYFPTIPYHFDRALAGSYSGEHMVTADVDHSIRSIRQAVSELRALIRWLKRERGGKVVVVGVSMGGYFSNMMALTEEEADYVVSVMYGNSLTHAVWHTRMGKYIKRDMIQGGMTLPELERLWSVLEPTNWAPQVPKENILLLHGLYDVYIPPADSNALWEAWGRPERILYPCGHAGIVLYRRQMARDLMNWLQEKFRLEQEEDQEQEHAVSPVALGT